MLTETCCQTTTLLVEALNALRWLARQWSRTSADADDLIQDTAERVFGNLDRYASGTNATAWVRSIMYHLAVDQTRRARSRRIDSAVDAASSPYRSGVEEATESEGELTWRMVDLVDVEWAADRLIEPVRGTVQLWMRERLSYGAISRRQGIPIGTVSSRLLRGRRTIREILSNRASNETLTPFPGGVRRPPRPSAHGEGPSSAAMERLMAARAQPHRAALPT